MDGETDAALISAGRGYFAGRRAKVQDFARRNFGLGGTLRLHRHALGWDIVKAPLNVALSPVFVATRLGALLADAARVPGVAHWLRSRRILLPTSVARETERLIVVDLLELPWSDGRGRSDRDALAEAMLAEPALRGLIRRRVEAGVEGRVAARLGDYSGTRSAVAEMTTAVGTIGAGALAFNALTPGVLSLAPALSAIVAHQAALAAFPLGGALGSVWLGLFPAAASPLLSGAVILGLMLAGAVFAAFAGVLADPIQTRLGIHERRLHRLIDALEDEFTGTGRRGFVAREHYLARMLDLADAGVATLRMFRG
ncbi:hypothetical protein LAZ40_16335 [Cereibacter sphaeroides]|uniref:DUF6635 family protein n=1 Tax=Cereibacter sphaeroides TaxID=1063 RepID=UPI001F1C66C8|nr:DUF6635 family protein [Cereibacter sphaeroides]MCE6960594.1 hypothetical protein [Cereibacter sphaeroides]MCE6969517.1 hypothetical protein [Cereibacter sphaeroides]MCE6972725.1 hypothetical protein [Cereibacter sphaeroides]